jgi:hypothetical protein
VVGAGGVLTSGVGPRTVGAGGRGGIWLDGLREVGPVQRASTLLIPVYASQVPGRATHTTVLAYGCQGHPLPLGVLQEADYVPGGEFQAF